jgi:hypothetical protein
LVITTSGNEKWNSCGFESEKEIEMLPGLGRMISFDIVCRQRSREMSSTVCICTLYVLRSKIKATIFRQLATAANLLN